MRLSMDKAEREKLLRQILWDYNIPYEDIEAVLNGEKGQAGHFTREKIFLRLLESYPWFTIIKLFTPMEIQTLLTQELIKNLRSPSLREKYEYLRKRLQEII